MTRQWLGVALVAGLWAGAPSRTAADPDFWDPRLSDLGLFWYPAQVVPGQWYWRLVRAEFENEQQAQGRHHIFYRCQWFDGTPLEGALTWTAWPSSNPVNFAWQATKGPGLDNYWGNYAMAGGNWCPYYPQGPIGPYVAFVDEIFFPSDSVWGMGLPCNRHVAYRLTWRLTLAE